MIKRQSCQLHSVPLTFCMDKCIENMDRRLFPRTSPGDINVLCCLPSSSFETLLAFFLAVKHYSLGFQPSLVQSDQEIPIMCPADRSPQEVSQDIAFSHQVRRRMLFTLRAGQFLLQSEGSRSPWWPTQTTMLLSA